MKCPTCVAAEQRSTVTLVNLPNPFPRSVQTYDEDGDYHRHDISGVTHHWECSRGHRGTMTTHQECPSSAKGCGFMGGVEMVIA